MATYPHLSQWLQLPLEVMYVTNLVFVNNFFNELKLLMKLLSFRKQQYTFRKRSNGVQKGGISELFQFKLSFIQHRLKKLGEAINHQIQHRLINDEKGSSQNITKCIYIFKHPLSCIRFSLKQLKNLKKVH